MWAGNAGEAVLRDPFAAARMVAAMLLSGCRLSHCTHATWVDTLLGTLLSVNVLLFSTLSAPCMQHTLRTLRTVEHMQARADALHTLLSLTSGVQGNKLRQASKLAAMQRIVLLVMSYFALHFAAPTEVGDTFNF
ncbi:MAG: hypothetical protein MHM6MM_002731 [Cercozoa sp. M6MM]